MYSDITLVSITAMSTRKLQQLQPQEEAADEKEDRHECDILVSKCERILTIPDTKILNTEDHQKAAAVSLTTITTSSDNLKLVDFSKRIALPPFSSADTEVEVEGENEDEPTTPRSVECRIPEIRPCPPAPKKPKSRPISKRKCSDDITHDDDDDDSSNNSNNEATVSNIGSINNASRLLDFSREVEALFPPRVRADLRRKIKKARSV